MNPFDLPEGKDNTDENLVIEDVDLEKLKNRFRSQIPQHLVAGLNPHEKYLFEEVSIQNQQNAWLMEQTIRQNRILKEVWRRQNSGDLWRTVFANKWTIFAWLATIAIIAFVGELVKASFKSIP